MRIVSVVVVVALGGLLGGCNTAGSSADAPFGGFSLGGSLGSGTRGQDAFGRRVDLDGSSTSPSLPSMGTPGLGK